MIKDYPISINMARLPKDFTADDAKETHERLFRRCEYLNQRNYFDSLSEKEREKQIALWFYGFAKAVVAEREGKNYAR